MKNLSLIVAIGKNREIGKNNKLLWHIKEDLQFFKEKTIGKTIIMGEKTFYSLPGILSNRKHIVLTKTNDIFPNEVEVFRNLDDLLEYIDEYELNKQEGISRNVGLILADLNSEDQKVIYKYIKENKIILTDKQANEIKKLDKITEQTIDKA